MGEIEGLPEDIQDSARKLMEATQGNTDFIFNLGVNYSGKSELVHAVNEIIAEGITKVDRQIIDDHHYTKGQPPVDFCIRTSGEYRLSNFMLWQLAYAELYFPKVCWPAFTSKNLLESLMVYQSRDRRFGAIKKA